MTAGARDDEADKQALRIGGDNAGNRFAEGNGTARAARFMGNPDAGIVLVSAERGAMRASPNGVYVYDEDGQHDVDLSVNNKPGQAGRQGELVEFKKAVDE